MNLPEFGVKKPVTNLMIFFSLIVLSLYSLTRLGIDMMPEIEPPVLTVLSSYSGASPEDVEAKVTEPLENQLSTTPGLEQITSRSREGMSVVRLKFIWGTNLDEASNDIRDRIERAKRFLPDIPDEMDAPSIFKFNTSMIPILYLGVTADENYSRLYDLIDDEVADALRQLPGVGTVQLQGALERQINVWVNRYKLEGYGLSVLDIKDALKKENVTQPVGSLKSGLTDYLLRVPGEFTSPQEIPLVILGKHKGRLVYLRDVAEVEDGFKEVTAVVRINRHKGLLMLIQKQSGTNTVEVAERVKQRLEKLKKNLPQDIQIHVIMDNSQDIVDSLDSLKSTVWQGGLWVILVVWFFLRRMLASLIIALTIPFSLLIAFIYLFLSGKTINTISLTALTIAIGMVVDNAIVVVDNVFRRLDKGEKPKDAAILGSQEMFLAIAASTLTTVVVFAPMMFIKGVVGIMFGELAIVVIVTLLASLFTAATFTPMLCSRWLHTQEKKKQLNLLDKLSVICEGWFKGWEIFYSRVLSWALAHKKMVVFSFLGLFIFSLFLFRFVGTEFMPEEDSGDIRPTINLPIGTRLEETDKVALRLEEIFKENVPEEKFIFTRSGQTIGMGAAFGQAGATHIVSGGAKLVPKTQRKRSVRDVAQDLRKKIRQIPGVLRTDIAAGNPLSQLLTGTGGKQVQLEILGHSFAQTDALAEEIKKMIETVPGTNDITVSREANRPELRVRVDREKASALGLDMRTLSESIKGYIEGVTATKYREKGQTYDINVRLKEEERGRPEDIESLALISPSSGKQIRLSSIANIAEYGGPQDIERKNRERVVKVECNIYRRSTGEVIEDIKAGLKKIVLPEGVTIEFGGDAQEQKKAFKDLAILLILGICLVYMVMAAQFESLLDPFIIMFAIPFTFSGVIIGFILTGTTLSTLTYLGIVMLMGIVVNNAIVLVSYIHILRDKGMSMFEAVIAGGKDRLRPVLMTTITTLAGWLPLAFSKGQGSEIWQPLGITMISGLGVSTLVTMIFVPTMYALFHRKSSVKALPKSR